MNETISANAVSGTTALAPMPVSASKIVGDGILKRGNREVITDFYLDKDVSSNPSDFAFKVFVRLNAKRVTLTLPLLSALHRLPIMRTSCLAAGPRTSVARTSWD
ncbi:MAG: hypothetical protein ACREXG_03810 [Polaromonas sp.]